MRPMLGIDMRILDPSSGEEIKQNGGGEVVEGALVVKKPWPGMATTLWGDNKRFVDTYFKPYPGYYFTGDGARRFPDNALQIAGRIDDVINISGHRLGTGEVEDALVSCIFICIFS